MACTPPHGPRLARARTPLIGAEEATAWSSRLVLARSPWSWHIPFRLLPLEMKGKKMCKRQAPIMGSFKSPASIRAASKLEQRAGTI